MNEKKHVEVQLMRCMMGLVVGLSAVICGAIVVLGTFSWAGFWMCAFGIGVLVPTYHYSGKYLCRYSYMKEASE